MVLETRDRVDPEALECFDASRVRSIEIARSEVVYSPGERVGEIYVILAGHVSIARLTGEGRRLVTDILGAGDAFGDLTLGSSSASIEVAEALTDLQLLAIDSGYAAELARCDPKWAIRLIVAAAGRVNHAVERLQEFSYRDVEARVAAAVLRYAFDGESTAHASHQEIGDIAGTYRETVTRVLNELQSRGVVRLGRCQVEIADRRALEVIAGAAERGGGG